jgi:hypothetical protein
MVNRVRTQLIVSASLTVTGLASGHDHSVLVCRTRPGREASMRKSWDLTAIHTVTTHAAVDRPAERRHCINFWLLQALSARRRESATHQLMS